MQYLRLSTASQIGYFGPFIDDTDFKTAKTALTIANTDVKLLKAGATSEANKNSGGGTHIANGRYYVTFDATDTNTLGSMRASVKMTASLEVWETFHVLSAQAFDEMFGSTIPAVNVTQIGTDSTAATNLKTSFNDAAGSVPWTGVIDQGTAQSVTSTTIRLRSAAAFADSELIGAVVTVISATTGAGQSRVITAYTGSTDTATVTAWTTTPTGTVTYKVFAAPPGTDDAANVKIDNMYTAFELDGSVYRLTTNALEQTASSNRYLRTGSATSAGSTTSFIDTAATETLDNALVDYYVRWTSGSNTGKTSRVSAYNGTTKGFTLSEALTNSVASGNAYELYPDSADRLLGITHTNAIVPTVSTLTGHTPQSGDTYSRLGAPAGASVSADVAAVKTQTAAIEGDTQDIQGRIPQALSMNGHMESNIRQINDTSVIGSGISNDKWRG